MSGEPSRTAELTALAEKYETLAAVRRRELEGLPNYPHAFYRALAAQFPGALKELDRLELVEIDRRATALRAAAAEGSREPWMIAVGAYHEALRRALEAKRSGGAARDTAPAKRCSMVDDAHAQAAAVSGLSLVEVARLLALKPPRAR